MKKLIKTSRLLAASVALFTTASVIDTAEAQQATIGMIYTEAARDRNGGDRQIRARLNQRIASTNRISRNSKTNFSLKRVAIWRTKYKESGLTLLGNLNDLFGGGSTANEKIIRNQATRMETRKQADLICLITTETGGGGNSTAIGWAGTGWASVANADFLQTQLVSHELGHNFAAVHAKSQQMSTSNGNVITVMWPSTEPKWAEHYSNPNVKYKNKYVTGTSSGDNASLIRRQAPINASRR